jgi:VanZ family protein
LKESTLRRLWVAANAVLVILIIVASLTPSPVVLTESLSDKYAHFIAYFALSLSGSAIAAPAGLWKVMLRCLLLGATLEIAQSLLTEHRTADLADLAANAAGIAVAWLIAGQGRAGWGLRAAAWLSARRSS